MDTLTQTTLGYIKPGVTVLDLGCGKGIQSKLFAQHRASVIAVDRKLPLETPSGIDFVEDTLEHFTETLGADEFFDVIFLRNSIQFLDKAYILTTLLPRLTHHLNEGGVIALQTFSHEPQPAFHKPLASLYTPDELISALQPLNPILVEERDFVGNDLNGISRNFYSIDVIVQN